jgi:ADP-L-glycero-D-manno-heptose 6-epimerase
MRSLVNKAFDEINETGKLRLFKSHNSVYADGEFGRDFIYIKDAVEMTLHFMESEVGGLFNIGSGRTATWNSLAHATFAAMDRPSEIEYIDMPEHLRGRYQYHTQADLNRIREVGYSAETTSLEAAVADYVQNYLVPGKHLGD